MCLPFGVYFNTYRLPFEYIKKLKELGFNDDKIFQKIIDETEENVYCTIEEIGKPFLEKLYKEDSTFYDNKDDKTVFNIYICEQIFEQLDVLEKALGE